MSSSRGKKLAKNTIIISIGKICTQLITFFLLPLYTSILSTEEYGIVDLLNTLVSLLLPIVTFQVEQAVFRELIEIRDDENKKKKVISSSIISVILQCFIYLLIFIIISPFIKNNYKYFLATNVISYIFSSLFLQIARGLGNNKDFSIASFLIALFTIIFNIVFLLAINLGANGMLLGTMLGQISGAIYLLFKLKLYKYISVKDFKTKLVKKLWKYSIPLIPNAICWWIFNASDRVIVTTFLGLSYTGLLSASLKFSNLTGAAYNIFHISWIESISVNIKDKDINDFFNKTFNTILSLFTSISILMISIMPFIFPILINKKFQYSYNLIPIFMIATVFHIIVSLVTVVYYGYKDSKSVSSTSIVAAIINIVVHICLIKFVGLYAAAISTFVAYFVMSIYRISDINKKYFKIRIDEELIMKTIVIIPIVFISYYINNLYFNIISLLLTTIYAYFINKKFIKNILNIFKDKFKTKKEM